jgi:hypothetical protein
MNLQGVSRVVNHGHYRVYHRWSRCYWGRYNQHGPRFAQALTGRTLLWARYQPHNRRRGVVR